MFDGDAHHDSAMEAPHFSGGTLALLRVLNVKDMHQTVSEECKEQ